MHRPLALALVCTLSACGQGLEVGATQPELALPSAVVSPTQNPPSSAKVELGRALFWDPILSGDKDVACATCHHPSFAYTDGRALSVGVGGSGLGPTRTVSAAHPHTTTRNSMTVLNTAFNGLAEAGDAVDPVNAPMFWDSRVRSLENQARGPITALDEMRGTQFAATTIFPELVTRLSAIPDYAARFTTVFSTRGITEDTIVEAIAAFERTLVDLNSSYDRFLKGDANALNASQQRGLAIFRNNGCANCHTGPMFSDFKLHRLGLPDAAGNNLPFRTGSLRNVTRSAPYMQNGSLPNLDAVFNFYDRVNKQLDPQLRNLRAPEGRDATDVKAFLGALSDGSYDTTVPATVPSGLTPGGRVR